MKAGWEVKTLGEVCEMYQPKTISVKEMVSDGAYPVFGANGVIGRYDKFNHEQPQLLVTCRGATCGSVNISEPKSWITGNAMVIKPKANNILIKFLVYYFRGGVDIQKAITGAAQPQITRTNLEPLDISFPSIQEQQRILAILDQAFESIAKARANAEQNQQNARALFESHLQSVFTQRSGHWQMKKLGDTSLLKIIDGDRGGNYPNKDDFKNEGYCLFLNTKNVRPDGFSFESKMFITEQKDKLLRNGKLQRQDVILTTRGTIGNVAIYDESVEFENVRINSGMLIFRPKPEMIRPSYLFEVFRSGIMKKQIVRHVSGAAQPQLPIKTLSEFKIPVPTSLEQQNEIVNSVRAIEKQTQRLEALYQRKIACLDELKKSLLQQAFAGEL